MAQIQIKARVSATLCEPGGAQVDEQPQQVADSPFWRNMIRQGLAEEVPIGKFLTLQRKKAKDERNKMAQSAENKGVTAYGTLHTRA